MIETSKTCTCSTCVKFNKYFMYLENSSTRTEKDKLFARGLIDELLDVEEDRDYYKMKYREERFNNEET